MAIDRLELEDMERKACEGGSQLHTFVSKLVSEVRRLQHELNDPNYQYSGRIHRQALLCRDAAIEQLRAEIKALKGSAP